MLGIFLMFFILFRNITLSFIGVVPNFFSCFFYSWNNWIDGNSFRYDDYNNSCNNNWNSSR